MLKGDKKSMNNSTLNNEISQSNANSLYSTFFSSKQLNKTFVSTHPHQLFKIMSRYQNELVEKEQKKKPTKKVICSSIKKKSQQYHRSNSVLQSRQSSTRNEGQSMKSLTQKKIINCDTNEEYDSDDNVDDSEEMRKKEEQEKKKIKEGKKVYQFFKEQFRNGIDI